MTSEATTEQQTAKSGHANDMLFSNLKAAVEHAATCDPDKIETDITSSIDKRLKDLIPDIHEEQLPDPCQPGPPSVDIAPACQQRAKDLVAAKRKADKAFKDARYSFLQARDVWLGQEGDYELDAQTADTTLHNAVQGVIRTYTQKYNNDSHSRNQVLYFAALTGAAQALQAYQQDLEAAAATVAGQAGTLLADYVTYVTAVSDAHVQKILDDAAAQSSFWTAIEALRDAP